MKTTTAILVVLFFLHVSIINAQQKGMPFNKQTGLVCYTETISNTDTKAVLYQKVKNWLENYTSLKGSIGVITDNAEGGKVIAKVNFQLTQNQKTAYFYYITFKLSLYVKDNKWMYEITNIYAYNLSTGGLYTMNSDNLNAPIEKNESFDVTDFSKKNKNAKNLDAVIQEIINDMKDGIKSPLKLQEVSW